jgi:DNA mismatch endonuclease (patch repair protein)
VDNITPEKRSSQMRLIRSIDTKPEMLVRRLVHSLGYRYRLHKRDLPGTPDLVFGSRQKVIFVHGCFWHRHLAKSCGIAHLPKSRLEYWEPKLERNRERDRRIKSELIKRGWEVLTVWECQLKNLASVSRRVRTFLNSDEIN